MTDKRTIHYDDLPATAASVLIALPHTELESYIHEARAVLDNAQLVLDRLRAIRMEKIRQKCAMNRNEGGDDA